MKFHNVFTLSLLLLGIPVHAGTYDLPATQGAQWLASQQNSDGSWGVASDIQPIYTSAAVRAFATAYKRQNAYFAGLTWLEGHNSSNVDLISRRVGALTSHGDDLGYALTYLQNAQAHNGASYSGWGLSSFYTSSTIDTALVLIIRAGPSTMPPVVIRHLRHW
jgi:squalene cyclase